MRRMLIHIDGSANDALSLATAIAFCRRLDGRLSVVHILQPRQIVPVAVEGVGAVIDNSAASEAAAAAARQAYEQVARDLPFVTYAEVETESTAAIERQGFLHDVTIVERLGTTEGAEVADFNVALFGTGGPVLVVPPSPVERIGGTVALVWRPSLQSARVLRSAIPLLRKADRIVLLTNADDADADPAEVSAYLGCHGVSVDSQPFRTRQLTARGRGRALLDAAKACGADLLVMGAYGESRLSAMLGLGRATEKVVTSCSIPLLIQA